MEMEIKRNAVWPTIFYVAEWQDAAAEKQKLVDLCYRLQREGRSWGIAGRAKRGLYESPPELFSHPEAQGLMQFCGAVAANAFEKDIYFPESWCHITNHGGYHDAHAHVDYARHGVCGIYYLQCAECTVDPPNGINRFYSPSLFEPNDVVDLAPAEGKLVLFPGHVRHAALPYSGREDRIVISFNARFGDPARSG
jgi:hypothetical protein